MTWVDACAANDTDEDDATRFDHGERTFPTLPVGLL